MGLGCGGCFAKYILCLFNFALFLAGGAVLTVGVWLNLDKKSFIAFTKIVESEAQIPEFKHFSQPHVISQLSYILIAAGAFIFLLSFLGYCGALRESRCCLAFYGIMLVLILILEITAAGMAIAYRAKAENETRKFLQNTIQDYYTPQRNKSDAVSLMWNVLMAQMSCCGVDSFEDFEEKFKEENSTQVMPAACCVLEGDYRRFTPKFPNCTQNPSSVNSYYMTGCYKTVLNWVLDHINTVIWVVLAVIFVELFTVFLSFCLCKTLQNYDDDK
ncbi:tetraspanin-18-like [Macrosteles quadrilineatus]|uniref:tetraspanin-18-like n=1 Tax=Macrosteles quadrilineatus TaxID=74068 RepID=UPI0023E24910|nr:tetraspanin-18-like [Macrosteles quadrilineatus]XP_054269111.1 tetraspanin-18-like [Macrosteles quadrilineatus]